MRRIQVLTILAIALVTSVIAQSPSEPPHLGRRSAPGDPQSSEDRDVLVHRFPAVHHTRDVVTAPDPTSHAQLVQYSPPIYMETESRLALTPARAIPPSFAPWWQTDALQPLSSAERVLPVDLNSLILDTLRHSAHVRAISDNSLVAETAITRAAAEFDSRAFMESKFVRSDMPTGSTLEAGFNVPRLRQEDWFYQAGTRKKNGYGGTLSLAQQVGLRNSNSTFFLPQDQGNSRLTLSYNQPLLARAGSAYNSSLIVLADLDTRIAVDRTKDELQAHLLKVTEATWQLYLQRCRLLQKQRHYSRAELILQRLEKRSSVDVLASQIVRAGAAVAMRRAELIRTATDIRNAESQLRALVNSPTLLADRYCELIPMDSPMAGFVPIAMQDALLTALENRPEVSAATREIEAARVRLKVARNELMPALDLVLETYLNGLRGNNNIGNALTDQFSVGGPGYTAGLVFEVPLGHRAARANHEKRLRELRQLSNRFQATVEELNADVESAVREVETTYREMEARYQAMAAAEADSEYLQRRWELLPGDDRAASFLLEDLLDSQDRLATAEFEFTRAGVDYTLSLTRLNRATGTLLKRERIELVRAHDGRSAMLSFDRLPDDIELLPRPDSSPAEPEKPTPAHRQDAGEPRPRTYETDVYSGLLQ